MIYTQQMVDERWKIQFARQQRSIDFWMVWFESDWCMEIRRWKSMVYGNTLMKWWWLACLSQNLMSSNGFFRIECLQQVELLTRDCAKDLNHVSYFFSCNMLQPCFCCWYPGSWEINENDDHTAIYSQKSSQKRGLSMVQYNLWYLCSYSNGPILTNMMAYHS